VIKQVKMRFPSYICIKLRTGATWFWLQARTENFVASCCNSLLCTNCQSILHVYSVHTASTSRSSLSLSLTLITKRKRGFLLVDTVRRWVKKTIYVALVRSVQNVESNLYAPPPEVFILWSRTPLLSYAYIYEIPFFKECHSHSLSILNTGAVFPWLLVSIA
jgi:hypothetical protein